MEKNKTKSSQEIIVTRPQLNFKCRMKITIDIQIIQYLSIIRCKMFRQDKWLHYVTLHRPNL